MELTVKNIGPVQELALTVPDTGGVVVLRGRNGRGKTKTIEAVESALSGRGKLEVRDGALSGKVEAFGLTITVGRSARRRGELEVATLEGRLSVADLVDPGIKAADAADARRIKALLTLAGVEHSPELFYGLLGGRAQFEAVASPAALAAADLVAMADRLKRDIEGHARIEEDRAENATGQAKGMLEGCAAVDLSQPHDAVALQRELEQAIRVETSIKTARAEAVKAARASASARKELEALEAAGGKSVEMAETLVANWQAERASRTAVVESIKRQIADLQAKLGTAVALLGEAENRERDALTELDSARARDKQLAELSKSLGSQLPPPPDEDDLREAADAVTAARVAVENGALVRQTLERRKKAQQLAAEASAITEKARLLREAAGGVDEVLSGLVAKTGTALRVEAGRLVLTTERGATYFGELSHGERWKIALDIAIRAVGPRGVLPIPQEAWEGLDPVNRREIAHHVRGRGVVILTAQASEDETITSEVL